MKNRIQIIKAIDRVLGSYLVSVLPYRKQRLLSGIEIKRVLIVRPGGMGDAALLIPVLKMVRNRYPGLTMDVLCEFRNSGIFKSVPWINSIFFYHNLKHMMQVMRNRYDMVVDTEQSHYLSAIVVRLLKTSYTLGFEAFGREKMFHDTVGYSHDFYESDMFLKLFRNIFDLPMAVEWSDDYFKRPSGGQGQKVQQLVSQNKNIVCLFPGASISERLWPEERWAKVADYLAGEGFVSVLLGGKMEVELCRNIETLCTRTSHTLNLAGMLSLLETAWLFEKAKLLVSTDSGILHLGVLCHIPTVSLFGPGIKDKWAPKGDRHHVICLNLPCSPCTCYGNTPTCNNGTPCMMEITPFHVIEAIQTLMR